MSENLRSRQANPLLDVDGLAERLGVTVRFVRRLVAQRRVPYIKLGSLVRFDPDDVDLWLVNAHVVSVDPVGTAGRQLINPPQQRRRASQPAQRRSQQAKASGR
jgi:excisionase family DNA binding protein